MESGGKFEMLNKIIGVILILFFIFIGCQKKTFYTDADGYKVIKPKHMKVEGPVAPPKGFVDYCIRINCEDPDCKNICEENGE
jgi:hypothetical protein